MLQGASLETEASAPTKLSVNSSDHSGRSRNGLLHAPSMSSFCFLCLVSLESRDGSPSVRLRSLLLRVLTEHGVESSRIESCDTDVEDVLEEELEGLVDKPGATIST